MDTTGTSQHDDYAADDSMNEMVQWETTYEKSSQRRRNAMEYRTDPVRKGATAIIKCITSDWFRPV